MYIKVRAYLTGTYIYNKMSLTEQVSSVITIAAPQPVRPFEFKKISVECVKSYADTPGDENTLRLIRMLDAIKDLKYIAGTTSQQTYDRIFALHISQLSSVNLEKIVSLAINYPPRVWKILSDMLKKDNRSDLSKQLIKTICPTTRFDLPYKTI